MHEYYTPKPTKFQAILDKIPIFVDYADFYVNTIMSTRATEHGYAFTIFNYFATYRSVHEMLTLNIDFASFPAFYR